MKKKKKIIVLLIILFLMIISIVIGIQSNKYPATPTNVSLKSDFKR